MTAAMTTSLRKAALTLLLGGCLASQASSSASAQELRVDEIEKGVVLLVVEFADGGDSAFGTGFFLDHDGLVATAEHTLFGYGSVRDTADRKDLGRVPRSATIISPALQSEFTIDATEGGFQCGKDLPFAWLDLCLLRVDLSEAQRQVVRPLDVSSRWAAAGETAWAFGPRCSDHTSPSCRQIVPIRLDIASLGGNELRSYLTTGTLIQTAYSGGPLVDNRGLVVGTCSKGDPLSPVPGITDLNDIAEFTPIQYLEYFDGFPISDLFQSPTNCDSWAAWDQLTHFDCKQLSVLAEQPARFCKCVCIALQTDPGALEPPRDEARGQFFECASPRCLADLAIATFQAVYGSTKRTDPSDTNLEPLIDLVGDLYAALERKGAGLSENEQAILYKSYGDFYYRAVSSPEIVAIVGDSEAIDRALSAYSKSLALAPDEYDAWRSLAGIFIQEGNLVAAHGALKESGFHGLPLATYELDHAYLDTLSVDLPTEDRETIDRWLALPDQELGPRIIEAASSMSGDSNHF